MQPSHSGTNGLPRTLVGMQWIEALINVSGLVGFVGVAMLWPKNGPVDGFRNREGCPAASMISFK
jgi:hypothetical protein